MDPVAASQKKSVLVAIPTEGNIPSASYDNHLEFFFRMGKVQEKMPFKCAIATVGGVFTPLARERIVEAAVRDGFDYVFMFDDDMLLPLDTLERLYNRNVDIVAPLAFMRRPPHLPVIFMQRTGVEDGQEWFSTNVVRNYPKERLFECDAVGFGAVLIKTEVIKKMKAPYFMSTCGTGEDVLFCHNARRQAKARVFCDTTLKLGHLASRTQVIDERLYESMNNIGEIRNTLGDYNFAKKEANLVA